MGKQSVLVAERDRARLAAIESALTSRRFAPVVARSAPEAMSRSREAAPAAAVVSLGLAEGEALALLRQMRQEFTTRRVPVLLAVPAGREDAAAAGLEAGAQDYLAEEDLPKLLGARLARMTGWTDSPGRQRVLRAGGLALDVDTGELVSPRGAPALTPCEREILRWLLSPPGRAYTRRMLVAAHPQSFPPGAAERRVDAHVASLRRKLGPAGACIETLRGIGYRLDPDRPGAAGTIPA